MADVSSSGNPTKREDKKRRVHEVILVSHTHWDREWYLPFELFRWRLVETLDLLLDLMERDKRYSHFTLDGQTVVLEDYLEVRPENRERLERLVRAGRLHVGPWYVLADEFLVSGESLIRNLLMGRRIARSFGRVMPVGYTPDPFGHIAQLPQLLRGFGIDSCIFWRGLEDGGRQLPTEFRWQAPDGSQVLAVHLAAGYGPAASLPQDVDAALARLLLPVAMLAPRATSRALLLLNGSDHLPPQPHLPSLLEKLNRRLQSPDPLAGRSLTHLFLRLLQSISGQEPPKEGSLAEVLGEVGLDPESLESLLQWMLGPALEALRGAKIRHGTLMDYLEVVRRETPLEKLPVVQGEQHNCKYISVLPGVLSSRLYLKQENFSCQILLERWAEPFSTIAWWLGASYPEVWLRRAWKLLLLNHPHDSICGCSVDQVHRDMERRFAWCRQLASRVLRRALSHIARNIDTRPPPSIPQPCHTAILVFNPHPWPRTDVVRLRIHLDQPAGNPEQYALYDPQGHPIPCQVTPGPKVDPALEPLIEQHAIPPINQEWEPSAPAETEHTLLLTFIASQVPAMGYSTYYLAPSSSPRPSRSSTPSSELKVNTEVSKFGGENGELQLEINPKDGTLTLHHKPSGRRYSGLLTFEDAGDVGDEYNYCPPAEDKRITSTSSAKHLHIRLVESGPAAATWEISMELPIPVAAAPSRRRRSSKTTQIPLRSLVTIYTAVPRVDVTTTLTNRAQDHRLRLLLPTELQTDTSWADTPFYVAGRPLEPPIISWDDPLFPTMVELYLTYLLRYPQVPGKPDGWFEDPSTTHPMQSLVDLNDGQAGLMVAARGLTEYEATRTKQGTTLALTLLRSVGWLSREDLTTRRGHAGPGLPTPEAQCLGTHRYHYALIPHRGDWRSHTNLRHAQEFAAPLGALQARPGQKGTLLPSHSFLSIEPPNVMMSALKKAEEGEATVIRLYESCGNPTTAAIRTAYPLEHVAPATLSEDEANTPNPRIAERGTKATFSIAPHRIQTLLLYLKSISGSPMQEVA